MVPTSGQQLVADNAEELMPSIHKPERVTLAYETEFIVTEILLPPTDSAVDVGDPFGDRVLGREC